MSDDLIIFGKNKEEHDKRLFRVLGVLEAKGLTVNVEKCQFFKREIEFFGMIFSEKGISPSIERVKALQNVQKPRNVKELSSFLGLATYSSRFINNFSTLTEPLRNQVKFNKSDLSDWGEIEDEAFKNVKNSLTTNSLAYFDPNLNTELVVDASPVGVAAVLLQVDPLDKNKRNVIAYASRTLSEYERKYAQVEKEALACVFGCERFHTYLFGHWFKLVTDNKAFQFIYSKASGRSQARIERWGLRLAPYDFTIEHRPGREI